MSTDTPQWMLDAAAALSTLDCVDSDGIEGWEFDGEWTAAYPECDEPGWEVSHHGRRLTLSAGCVDFAADTDDNITDTARRLLAALDSYNARKTHCKRGHPFNEENTRIRTSPNGRPRRSCRVCDREGYLRRRARQKAREAAAAK